MTKITELCLTARKSYGWYYNHDVSSKTSSRVCSEFDRKMNEDDRFSSFVRKVVVVRGDPISSDREVLAFMNALRKMGGAEAFYGLPDGEYMAALDESGYTDAGELESAKAKIREISESV